MKKTQNGIFIYGKKTILIAQFVCIQLVSQSCFKVDPVLQDE